MKKRSLISILAIYSLIFLNNGTQIMTPAMDTMVAAFPNEPYSKVLLISTLPALVALPFTLISGSIVGTWVRYRTMLLTVVPIYLISGVAPVFLNDLNAVLFCRAVFGVCLGMIAPQGNALILRTFRDEERYRFLGYSTAMIGVAGVVFQMLGGYLCAVGWRYTFLGYLVSLIPLGLILFGLVEPERTLPKVKEGGTDSRKSPAVPKGALPLLLLVMAVYLSSQTKTLTLSSIVATEGLGDSRTSALIMSVATISAMSSGYIFPRFCKVVKGYRLPVLLLVMMCANICNMVSNVLVMCIGYGVGALALMMTLNLMILRSSRLFGTEQSSKATGLIQFGDKGGCFLATYFTTAMVWLGETMGLPVSKYKVPVMACVMIYLIAAAVDVRLHGADVTERGTE